MIWHIQGVAGFVDRATDSRVGLANFETREISKGPRLLLRREAVVSALEKFPGAPISGNPPLFNSHSHWSYGEVTSAYLEGDAIRVRGVIRPGHRDIVDAIRTGNLGLCLMLRNVEVEKPTEAELATEVDDSDPLANHTACVTKCEFSSIALVAHGHCDFKGTSVRLRN